MFLPYSQLLEHLSVIPSAEGHHQAFRVKVPCRLRDSQLAKEILIAF